MFRMRNLFFYFVALGMAIFCLSLVTQYQKDLRSVSEIEKKIIALETRMVQLESEAYKREYRLKVLVEKYNTHETDWVTFKNEIDTKLEKKKGKK